MSKLKRVNKLFPLKYIWYSGEWKNNFPWKPKIKNKKCISNINELKTLSYKLQKVPFFAFDTETNSLRVLSDNDDFMFVGISFSWGENDNYYIPVGHLRDEDIDNQVTIDVLIEYLIPVFERTDIKIYGWNLKFDFHVLKRIGIDVKTKNVFDGMLASWLCDENTPNGLKENSLIHMGIEQEHFKEATETIPKDVKREFGYKPNSKVPFNLVLIKDALPYVCGDAFYTLCNCKGFEKELEKESMDKIYYKMYIPFLFVLFDMEEKGVSVDTEYLKKMQIDIQKDIDSLQYKIYELSGVEFNINSSQQKAEILFGYKKPDKKVLIGDKLPKKLLDLKDKFKNNEITMEDVIQVLDKEGYRIDEEGKVFKKSNSNMNLLKHSFDFPIIKETDSGSPATDNEVIWILSQKSYSTKRKKQGVEMCKLMLDYSKLIKLKTAFIDGLLEQLYKDGKAHPSFNQIGTDSGRLSCSNPNLQQLPKAGEDDKYKIRSAFIGSECIVDEDGNFVSDNKEFLLNPDYRVERKHIIAIDYHNLEMICLRHFSDDKNLTEMFANDDDAHGSTAVNMFQLDCSPSECKKLYPHLRQAAKTINFMLMYGGGAKSLYDSLKNDQFSPLDLGDEKYLKEYHCKTGEQVARIFIDKYFESYSGVNHFITTQKRNAHKNKYVYTILRRKRRLPDINSLDSSISSYNERLAVNSAIQGTAGDITINAQIKVFHEKRLKEMGCYMLIQVHDEIVFECPEKHLKEAIEIIKFDMEHPFGTDPNQMVKYLRADEGTGLSYQEAK